MPRPLTGPFCLSLLLASVAAPAQVPAGGQFRVNTGTLGDQGYARPVMQPDGNFVVVWQGPDAISTGIFGQRFAASGIPRGGEFAINTHELGNQWRPAAAIGRKGDLVVVWEGDRAFDGAWSGIQGRRYDAAGVPLGAEFSVTATSTFHQQPDVGLSSDGRFVVSWFTPWIPNVASGIKFRQFDAAGRAVGGETVVSGNVSLNGGQKPGLDVQANGTFVVAWEGSDYYGDSSVYMQRFDAEGHATTGQNIVNVSYHGRRQGPSVSSATDGRMIVTWTSEFGDGSGTSLMARRVYADGAPEANEFVANTYTDGNQSGTAIQVAHDGVGNFVITWQGPPAAGGTVSGIHAQRFDAAGVPRGAEFDVSTSTAPQWAPSIASDAVGNFVIAWEGLRIDGSGTATVAHRFGGLGPATLELDTGGNGVLEAGETVDLRPAWRNFNGTAQTFSGTLGAITGPAGAAYSISDPVGDYGTLPDGVDAGCTDCYEVSVSNPALRPTMHWDASAVEGILPDAQGQQKQWLLHVGGTFTDVPSTSAYYRAVETLVHHGITGGCWLSPSTPNTFCPAAPTTREQIAPLLLAAREGSAYRPPACKGTVFKDVTSRNPFCDWIEELAHRGVVTGCAPNFYCPRQVVAREEIAVLLLRTLDPTVNPSPCVPPNVYGDVPETHPYCRWIEELANRGLVSDCGGGNYCPADGVTREQAAFFITGGFGLALYGP